MTKDTVGREPVQIVEIVQPLCANTYGVAPCTATGAATDKCYNTRATCQDTANYDGSSTLSLYFSKGGVAERGVSGANYIIPSLVSVSTSPTKINLAGVDPDQSGLGNRALVSIVFQDHPHTDRIVDPYLSDRTFDPFARGSFWTKWIVRVKYWPLIQINIYEGYDGEALSAMVKRTYFMDSISGPDASGRVTIKGKDVLARLEERQSQVPEASVGELYRSINETATEIEVANATTSEYDASGLIKIDDELITYSAVASSTYGITFTVTKRGYNGTTPADHAAETLVQQCVEYDNQFFDLVLEDLLTRSGIDAAYLDTTNWEAERNEYRLLVKLTAILGAPESVSDLVSEILIQIGAYMWWDERDQLVKLRIITGAREEPPLITDEANIMEGLTYERLPRQRLSQVYFYYGIKDFFAEIEDANNYSFAAVIVTDNEDLYEGPSIKKIYSRWLPTVIGARSTAQKIAVRYKEVPRRATFMMDAKDRTYWTGDQIRIRHFLDVDQYGAEQITKWVIISAEEIAPGETIKLVCEDTTLYGKVYFIQATGSPDYSVPADIDYNKAFIGNSSGLLSDGTEAAKVI